MSTARRCAIIGFWVLGGLGCGDAGGQHLALDLFARGTAPQTVSIRDGSIRLTSAHLAIGPLYLCASHTADPELCESALAEWRDAVDIDALEAQPEQLGVLDAVTGTVRSGMLDYGISWLLTKNSPQPSTDAQHSALLAGNARGEDGSELSFEAAIDVLPVARGGSALQLRLDEHTLAADDTLTLRFDPGLWLTQVRYTDLVLLDDDQDGHVVIKAGTQPYEAILQAMSTESGLPSFDWE